MSDRKLPDDRELDDFLAGKGDVSRRYRESSPREAAPPELDRAVLEHARRAIEHRSRRGKFSVPLALAASVVVTFSVVMLVREEHGVLPEPTATMQSKSVAPAPSAPADSSAIGNLASQPEVQMRDDRAARAEAARREEHKKEAVAAKRQAEIPQAPAPRAAMAPPAMEQSVMEQPAMERRALAPVEPEAAPAAKMNADSLRQSGGARTGLTTQSSVEQDQHPEAWLDRIRSLRDRERIEDARAELEAFRRANPDYAIPDDLKALLPPP